LCNSIAHSQHLKQKYSFIKHKTSLKGSRIIKGKENTTGNITPEENAFFPIVTVPYDKRVANLNADITPFENKINQENREKMPSIFCKRFDP
jgi:hypothetical protein